MFHCVVHFNRETLTNKYYDRPVDDREYLWTTLKTQAAPLITTVTVPRRGNRAARIATLEVRYKEMTIRPPKRKPGLRPVTLNAIAVTEIQAPDGVEPIEWLLLTNNTTVCDDDALEALR